MATDHKQLWAQTAHLTTLRNEASEKLTAWASLRNRLTILYALYKNDEQEKKLIAHIDADIKGAQERINLYEAEISGYDAQLEKLTPVLREQLLDGDTLS